jgi:hypothetical protein
MKLLPSHHRAYPWIAVALSIIALARCAATVRVFNHTTDELAHIAGAVGLYESGRNVYMVEHPTLQRLVVGAALRMAGVRYEPARGMAEVQARNDANAAGEEIVFRGRVPYWRVLAVARIANLVFFAALLFFVYRLARYLASPRVALLACAFITVDANFLAHAALATTDVPAAAGFVAAAYYALRWVARSNWKRTLAASIALGLAMSCKFTCVLLAPAVVVLIGLRVWRKKARSRRRAPSPALPRSTGGGRNARSTGGGRTVPKLRYFIAIPLLAFATLWATYVFNIGRLEDQHLFDTEKSWQKIPMWVKSMPMPMPAMPLGFMFMAAIAKSGFPCYFNGQLDFKGHVAYFPEAIAIKSPSTMVIALLLAIGACALAKRRRPWINLTILLPPVFLLLTAMTGKLQIGIRHVLPVIPFIYIFITFWLGRGTRALFLSGLIALAAIETATIHPDYIAFFNRLAGGPRAGQKYLADSNLDWGQDVARLAEYLKSSGRSEYHIKVSGVWVAALVEHLGLDPKRRLETAQDMEKLRQNPRGLLAIGINAKLGLEDFKKDKEGRIVGPPDYSWVRKYPLVKRVGYSIEVYDLDGR